MKIPYSAEPLKTVWAKHPHECQETFLLESLGISKETMVNQGWRKGVHQIELPDSKRVVQVAYREGWAALYSA